MIAANNDEPAPNGDVEHAPAPEIPNPVNDEAKVIVDSKTMASLNEVDIFTRSREKYYNLVNYNHYTAVIGEKIFDVTLAMGNFILDTKAGRLADGVLSKAIDTVHSCWTEAEPEIQHNGMNGAACSDSSETGSGFILTALHCFFRYFPALLLLRWFVDLYLLGTELTLALVKDWVRLTQYLINEHQVSRQHRKKVQVQDQQQEEQEQEVPSADKPNLRSGRNVRSGAFDFFWGIFMYCLTLMLILGNMMIIYFVIPTLSIQFLVLDAISNTLHGLAGMNECSNPTNGVANGGKHAAKDREIIASMEVPYTMSRRKWLTDSVLDRIVGVVANDIVFGKTLLNLMKVERPVSVARNVQKYLRSKIQLLCYGNVAPYLNMDYSYNEQDDPDFVPVSADESNSSENDTITSDQGDTGAEASVLSEAEEDGGKDGVANDSKQGPNGAESEEKKNLG